MKNFQDFLDLAANVINLWLQKGGEAKCSQLNPSSRQGSSHLNGGHIKGRGGNSAVENKPLVLEDVSSNSVGCLFFYFYLLNRVSLRQFLDTHTHKCFLLVALPDLASAPLAQ